MKIFEAFKSGILRSLKVWKGVLIVWFFSLLMISLFAIPMKGALKAGFRKSMITEKLMEGMNGEVIGDLLSTLKGLSSYFFSGVLFLIFLSILMNAFLGGGMFSVLRGNSGRFSSAEFFMASARHFWSFLVITLIISVSIFLLGLLVIGIPVGIVAHADSGQETRFFMTVVITGSVFLLISIFFFLVADYARACKVANEGTGSFRALGFGFSQTFRTFLSSYPLMIILLIVQLLYGWLVLKILTGMKPVTGSGVFLLFFLSQFLFFIKLLLKAWRYGSVTSLMELNSEKPG